MKPLPRRSWASIAVLIVCSGCAGSSGATNSSAGNDGSLTRGIVKLLSLADTRAPLYRSAREAMPTTMFKVGGDPAPVYVSDLFVVGTVQGIDKGASFAWPSGPQVVGQQSTTRTLAFNASGADISDVVLRVNVERSVARSPELRDLTKVDIGIALTSPADLEGARAEYPKGARIAAILQTNEKTTFQEDHSLFGALGSGQFLGRVSPAGIVSFPIWSEVSSQAAQGGADTSLEQLLVPIDKPIEAPIS